MQQKGFAISILVIGIVILATASAAAFYLGQSFPQWKTFQTPKYNFTFRYPPTWDTKEIGGTLMVAPRPEVDRINELEQRGVKGFGGGKFLTLQIIEHTTDYREDTFRSDDQQITTREDATLSKKPATRYTQKFLTSLPGIEEGDVFITYFIQHRDKKYEIQLFDLNYRDIFEKILDSFTFI